MARTVVDFNFTYLKHYMKVNCITNNQLGEMIGSSGASVSRWINNVSKIQPKHRDQLCKVLKLDPKTGLPIDNPICPYCGKEIDKT